MTIDSFRRWYWIHKWTSLVCTVFLLLLCLTGLPLVFSDELRLWLGEAVEPPEHATTSTPIVLDTLIKDAQSRRPNDSVKFLTRDDDGPAWFVVLGETPAAQENSATFMYDSRTAEFLHAPPQGEGVVNFLFRLHVDMLAGLPGTLFLGVMGLLFVASVASGVVVYGPFMRKLPFGVVRSDRGPRLHWLDLHNLLGIVTVIWGLVVGITGVVNTLDRPLLGYWQMTEIAEMVVPWKNKNPPARMRPVDEAVRAAEAEVPDMLVRFIAFPGTPFASPYHYMVFMRGDTPLTARLLKPVLVDAETGQMSARRDLPWYLTLLLVSQPLHFGDYGGMPLKIVWALLDAMTIVVLCSGLYLWWRKRQQTVEDMIAVDVSRSLAPEGRV